MNEQPTRAELIPPQAAKHPLGIWLWLAPVISVSLTPVLIVLFAGFGAWRNVVLPGEAWQIAGVALGVVSGMLVGVGASQAVRP